MNTPVMARTHTRGAVGWHQCILVRDPHLWAGLAFERPQSEPHPRGSCYRLWASTVSSYIEGLLISKVILERGFCDISGIQDMQFGEKYILEEERSIWLAQQLIPFRVPGLQFGSIVTFSVDSQMNPVSRLQWLQRLRDGEPGQHKPKAESTSWMLVFKPACY